MIALGCLALGLAIANAAEAGVSAQVIGGEDAADGDYPWMGALIHSDYDDIADDQFCGCMLIDSNRVLTAAHCVDDRGLDDFVIAIGDVDLNGSPRVVAPKMILINSAKYHRLSRGGDVALIQLKEPITDRRSIDAGTLPGTGRILGWGRTALSTEGEEIAPEAILQVADIPIHEPGDAFIEEFWTSDYLSEFIATGQVDPIIGALPGDSGGPLLIADSGSGDWVVAGIDSWGGGRNTDRAAISMFTDVSVYSDWIDAIVGFDQRDGPTVGGLGFETGEFAEFDVDGLPGLRIWPFGAGNQRGLEVSGDLRNWQEFRFRLDDANGYRFNDDGSVSVFPRIDDGGSDSLFIRKRESLQAVPRSGPFPLVPYQITRGSSSYPGFVYEQNQSVFTLSEIEAGRTYSVGLRSDQGSVTMMILFEKTGSELHAIDSVSVHSSWRSLEFSTRSGAEYWLAVYRQGDYAFDFELFLQESGNRAVGPDQWHDGVLEEGDSPFRRAGVRMDAFSASEYISGDVKIEVDSVFDAEMGVYDRTAGTQVAYHDQGAENDLESFIVNGEDLYEGDFRIFNFDHGIYGRYRFRYSAFEEDRTVSVGVNEQRAITSQDLSYSTDSGDLIYYEFIDIRSTDQYTEVTVVVHPLVSQLVAGVYNNETRKFLEFDYGGYFSFTFEPEEGVSYAVYVASVLGSLNENYELKIVGDELIEDPEDEFSFLFGERDNDSWEREQWLEKLKFEDFARDRIE